MVPRRKTQVRALAPMPILFATPPRSAAAAAAAAYM